MATIDDVRELREAGRHEEHRAAALALVAGALDEPWARFEAGWALARAGDARGAIRHYDAGYAVGVPPELRRAFVVGYGSALRAVGRAEEAVAVLAQAAAEDPGYPAYTALLGLALADAGHVRAALAALLGCALDAARPGAFDGHERALAESQRLLLDEATAQRG